MQPESNGTALAVVQTMTPAQVDTGAFFSPAQVQLIKDQIAKNCTNDELKLFLYQCARTGLDPFSRQIYAISRLTWDPELKKKVPKMSIQTGIDGFRLIAERTRRYAPGPEPVFEYDSGGNVRKATAFVKKLTADGTWHTVAASAYYDEYVQTYDGKPSGLWTKPHIMLGKCAEAQALRRAFPAELSGIYTAEEMSQAGPAVETTPEYLPPPAAPPPHAAEAASHAAPKGDGATAADGNRAPASPVAAAGGPAPSAPATSDTGEAPSEEDLDEFADVIKRVKWTSQHVRNWCQKHFSQRTPDGFTKAQLRDAFSMVYAFAQSKESYAAKVAELQAAGRINPEAA
jgi:phage recombination protein Bet